MSGPLTRAEDPTSLRPAEARIGADFDSDLRLDVGSQIGRFELRERIGQGGMGTVFVAHDPALAREVAIKVLRPDRVAQLDEARLVREAQALAQLQHPNVVAVHDVGKEGGLTYLAMDYVRGRTLRDWLRSEAPSVEQIAKVLSDAGDGISAAHAKGLLHRDIKPSNILLADDGRVVVLDFGLARGAGSNGSTSGPEGSARLLDSPMTRADSIVGTPRYMAPEILDKEAPASDASDQFAFAVTLFEATFGYPPFPGNTRAELVAAMRRPLPPLERDLPPPFRRVLQRGLAVRPDARFASMAELVATLRTAIGFRSRRARRRRIAAASLIVSLVAAGAVHLAWPTPAVVDAQATEVDRLRREATEAAARARYVYPSPDEPDEATALRKILELEKIDAAAAAELRVDFGRTLSRLGDRYWSVPEARGFALDYYVQALVFDDRAEPAALRTGLTVGQRLALQQRASKGEFSHGELLAAEPLIALANEDEQRRGEALRIVAKKRRGQRSDRHQATLEELAQRWTPAPPAATSPGPPPVVPEPEPEPEAEPTPPESKADNAANQAVRLTKEGQAALRSRDYARAEQSFRGALAASPRHAPALIGLSDVFFERTDYGRAVQYAKKAVAAKPGNGRYHLKLGDAYFRVDRYRDAEAAYKKALELGRTEAKRRLDKVHNYIK